MLLLLAWDGFEGLSGFCASEVVKWLRCRRKVLAGGFKFTCSQAQRFQANSILCTGYVTVGGAADNNQPHALIGEVSSIIPTQGSRNVTMCPFCSSLDGDQFCFNRASLGRKRSASEDKWLTITNFASSSRLFDLTYNP